jgi:hypothetical protein
MDTQITWQPLAVTYDINDNGKLDPRERRALPDSAFAFPQRRELPLVDEELTRAAIAELAEISSYATDEERRLAANNIRAAARYYGIALDALPL